MRCLSVFLFVCATLRAGNGVQAGHFVVERPTLICLGFEWEISGDDNRNATVDVSYRRSGATDWKQALPLLRIGGERVFRAAEHLDYTVPDRFAGSILDLDPDTEYEVRLTMKDPDGVTGQAVQTAKVRTRGEPKAATGGRTLHVYPPDWKGQKQEPAFTRLERRLLRRRPRRLERSLRAQGAARRRHPGARRLVQGATA